MSSMKVLSILSLLCLTVNAVAQLASDVASSHLKPVPVAGGFESIGPVAKNLWPFNALDVQNGKFGGHVLYVTSFNSAGHGQLIRLDYLHHRTKSWILPVGIGSWGIVQGKDGNLYLGSYNGGELLCFDPRKEQWLPLPQASDEFRKREFIICDLVEAPNGDIYYGTYPGAHLVRYSKKTHTVTDLGRAADESYLRHLAVTPDGLVLCAVGTRHSRIRVFDPKSGLFRDLDPSQAETSGVPNQLIVQTKNLVVTTSDHAGIKLFVYDLRTLKLDHTIALPNVESVMPAGQDDVVYEKSGALSSLDFNTQKSRLLRDTVPDVLHGVWYPTANGGLVGLRVQSYVYVHRNMHNMEQQRIGVEGLGQDVLWLRSAPNGAIFGGPALGQTMFSYSPTAQRLTSYDQVIDQGGEIYYAIPHLGKLYTISYIEATLAVYDPTQRWRQGSDPTSNPRTILHIPEQQYRPVGGIHLGPQGKLFVGSQPDYGLLGGALSAFDPQTGDIQVHRNIIPQEEVGAVAADDRFVYAGTDPFGGGGSAPEATQAHFIVWDPVAQKVVFNHPLDDKKGIAAIATVNGHAYFVDHKELMDYDREHHTLSSAYSFTEDRAVPLESLQAAQDGTLWGILGRQLARIDPAGKEVTFFPETVGRATSGLTIGSDGTVYFGHGTDIWTYHPPHPSPPASFEQ
jgi:streptogramin lyase